MPWSAGGSSEYGVARELKKWYIFKAGTSLLCHFVFVSSTAEKWKRGKQMATVDQSKIRNFCIIAHIDHGKSTLRTRIIEKTGLFNQP